MIPSLASAGYLEPLDEYMKKADFQDRRGRRLWQLHDVRGQTYGIPTDGNVHIHIRART